MDLIEGRWTKRYINSFRDKQALDNELRGRYSSRSGFARARCEEANYPELTVSEVADIDAYWARWGVKINDYSWHRMYYAVTGIHDPRFMPDDFVGLCLYPYYNDEAYADAWRDKNMFERLVPCLKFPDTIGRRVRGRFVGSRGEALDERGFAEHLFNEAINEPVIVKDARLSGHGRGVTKHVLSSVDDAMFLVEGRKFSENYLVQRCIRQHSIVAAYNESSANVLRLLTWRHDDTVDLLFSALRYGLPGELTDMCERNGREIINVVAVDKNGCLSEVARNLDGETVGTFKGEITVPSWDRVVDAAKKAHMYLDNFDLVGWDFSVDEFGNPICLEYNIQWPGTVAYQLACGPYAGNKTDDLLAFLKDETKRINYLPYYMQLGES